MKQKAQSPKPMKLVRNELDRKVKAEQATRASVETCARLLESTACVTTGQLTVRTMFDFHCRKNALYLHYIVSNKTIQ